MSLPPARKRPPDREFALTRLVRDGCNDGELGARAAAIDTGDSIGDTDSSDASIPSTSCPRASFVNFRLWHLRSRAVEEEGSVDKT